MPLLIGVSGTQAVHWLALPMAIVCWTVSCLLSRWMTPLQVERPDGRVKYLNVNLCYELWKDLNKWSFLRFNHGDPKTLELLFRMFCRTYCFITGNFLSLMFILKALYPGAEAQLCRQRTTSAY